jgi:hypothetical protein
MRPVQRCKPTPNIAAVAARVIFIIGLLLTVGKFDVVAQTGSFPYPKWFFSPRDSTSQKLTFRMFGFEGMARNLFVLSCIKDNKNAPVTIELIPPKALEAKLRSSAFASPRPTTVRFVSSQNTILFEGPGEYDKIAAFIDLKSDDQFGASPS